MNSGLRLSRSWLFALWSLAALAPAQHAVAASCFSAPSGLLGWWPGDGSANDIAGANNGTLQAGAIAGAAGLAGSAFAFDGTNGYVQIPDSPVLRPTNLTVEAWVLFNSLDSAGSGGSAAGQQYIVFKQNSRNNFFEGYNLNKTRISGGDVLEFIVSSALGELVDLQATTRVATGIWYHVAGVRGSNFVQLYVNGQLEQQTNVSFAQDYGSYPLYFGTSGETYWDHKLNGLLDEVSLYNRALGSDEIAAVYAAGAAGKCKGAGITVPPQSQAVLIGSNALFTVTVTGFGSLNYQWQFNGAKITGAISTSLLLNSVQSSNAGSYTVVVTNTLGSTISAAAVLTVLVPPSISAQPQNLVVTNGNPAAFSLTASGTAPLNYQWRKNGTPIAGATATSYSLASATTNDAASYDAVLTNVAGAVTSSVVALTVYVPPGFSAQPQSVAVNQGGTAVLSTAPGGIPAPGLQWFFGSSAMAGQTLPTLTLTNLQPTNEGGYYVVASNAAGSATSAVATVTMNVPPGISGQPQNLVATNSNPAAFSLTASGTSPLSFQWRKNGTPITGATATSYSLASATTNDAASYDVVVTNVAGAATSSVATLTVYVSPWFTVQPTNSVVTAGSNAVFTAGGLGIPAPALQWFFGTNLLTGETSQALSLTNVQPGQTGGYYCVATNGAGAATSSVATLTIYLTPTITAQPQSRTNVAGTAAVFTAAANGTAPLTYQWQYSGANLVNDVHITGATVGSLVIAAVHPSDAGSYTLVVSNVAGVVTSAVATLTVTLPPALNVPPASQSVKLGANASFIVIASGTLPLSYQWWFNGASIAGAAEDTLLLSNVQLTNAGSYTVVVTNMAGSATSAVAALTVLGPPVIEAQPASLNAMVGTNASFSVTAAGTPLLSYQWQFNGTKLGGATDAILLLNNVQPTNAGSYSVVVTNVAGAATSTVAVLTVLGAPVIEEQPAGLTIVAGASAGFSVTASGTPSPAYQWQFNGTGITGATGATLVLSNAQPANAGSYTVVATNAAGSATSAVAVLTILVPPSIAVPPASLSVLAATNASFSVSASGTAPLGYQWQLNGVAVGGNATNTSLLLTNVQPADAGSYTVVVTNVAGAATSAVAVLTVLVPPVIAAQPVSLTLLAGTNAGFSVTAYGTPPLSYQWQFNGAALGGAVGTSLLLTNVQPVNAGSYTVVISNAAGTITSAVASLTVLEGPVIDAQPASLSMPIGATASFSVSASGSQPLQYQWRFNGEAIGGATGIGLLLTNVQPTNAGSYVVVVTNPAGSATSAVAVLTVASPPVITIQPASMNVAAGTNASLSVTASGTAPLSYQWQFNGVDIWNGIGSSLLLTNVQPGNAGSYQVVVTNAAGSTTSAVATLTVNLVAACVPPASGLVGWWTGNGSANDNAGANNGTLQGAANASAAGVVGSAFSLDGTNDYVQVPDAPALRPTNLTIEAWIRFSSLDSPALGGSAAGEQYIVFKQNTSSFNFEGFALTKTRVTGRDLLDFQVSPVTGTSAEITSVSAVTTGVWYHVAAVRGSNYLQLYVNGQLESQTNVSFAQNYGSYPLYFGSSGQPSWDHKFAGTLDEVSLYNRALSPNEVAAIYAAGANGKCRGVTITAQPQSRTVAVGANVSLTVTASGSAPLSYQWQRDGANLVNNSSVAGAYTAALTLANVSLSDSANYQVIVADVVGSATSAVAVLTVAAALTPPIITNQPASEVVTAGTNAVFSVAASGAGPLSYQWVYNGTNLTDNGQVSGSTSSTLAINYALPANSGAYSVVVTNLVGAVTSAVATLTVNPPTGCLSAPAGLVGWWPGDGSANDIVGGNNGILQGTAVANAAGFNGQAFQFDGTNGYVQIPDSPTFHPTNLTVECWVRFDTYQVPGNTYYSNQQYIVFKQNSQVGEFEGFGLTKDHDPQGDVFLWEVASPQGELIRIDSVSTVVTGVWYHVAGVRGPDYVQLYKDGQLEVQTNVNFPQDYGTFPLYFGTSGQSYYDRRMHGELDEVGLYNRALSASEIAALYAAGAAGKCKGTNGVLITLQPQNQTVTAGSNVVFSVTGAGIAPLSYQWQFNGAAIVGATGTNLTLANVQSTNAGVYKAVVSNPAGSALSVAAALTVLGPPTITQQATNQTVAVGGTASFSVAAAGFAPLAYQWLFNGTNLSGASAALLSLTNLQLGQAGSYSVLVTNSAGSATSAVAVLTVASPPSLLNTRMTAQGAFAFTISGAPGLAYVVEVTTNLHDWAPLNSGSLATGQVDFVDAASSNSVSRFYRARLSY